MKKTAELTYKFDPEQKTLTAFCGSKPKFGYMGDIAVQKFMNLLDSDVKMEIATMKDTTEHSRKVRAIRAIWHKMGIDQYRADILSAYGVISTKDLTNAQLDELIAKYSQEYNRPANDDIRRLRSEILTLLQKLGIYATNNDWTAVNNYLLSDKIAGKLLMQLSIDEMLKLRKKLHSITDKNAIKKTEIDRLKMLN